MDQTARLSPVRQQIPFVRQHPMPRPTRRALARRQPRLDHSSSHKGVPIARNSVGSQAREVANRRVAQWARLKLVAKATQEVQQKFDDGARRVFIWTVVLAIGAGLAVAYVRGSLTDRAIMILTTVALSISFLVYIIVGQYLFGFILGWFPVQGWTNSVWKNLITYAPLPVFLAVLVSLAPQTRLYRSFFLDEIGQDYVRTARAKGVTENTIMLKHVLRNAMIPILTNVATGLPGVFIGSFLIEVFFSIPGLGREILVAVNRSDYPVIQAATVYLAALTMVINLITDVLYKFVDPRVTLK